MDAALHKKILEEGRRTFACPAATAIDSILEYGDTRPQWLACMCCNGSTGRLLPEA
jgi:hypothetical protein